MVISLVTNGKSLAAWSVGIKSHFLSLVIDKIPRTRRKMRLYRTRLIAMVRSTWAEHSRGVQYAFD